MGHFIDDAYVICESLEQKLSHIARDIEAKQDPMLDMEDICLIKDVSGALKNMKMVIEMDEKASSRGSYSMDRPYGDRADRMTRDYPSSYGDDYRDHDYGRMRGSRGRNR